MYKYMPSLNKVNTQDGILDSNVSSGEIKPTTYYGTSDYSSPRLLNNEAASIIIPVNDHVGIFPVRWVRC